jgi:SNF2 family DNA or RNA helicase
MLNKFKVTPYNHQLECLNKFGRKEFFCLAAEQGTGKTFIIINDIADLASSHDLDAVIVFAPNGVHTNWVLNEIPKHMPEYIRYRAAAYYASPNKKDKEKLDHLMNSTDTTELKILTMNWESLQNKKGVEFAFKFALSARKLMVVADESQKIKNPQAMRTKNLMKLKKHAHYRRTMSGTSILNSPFDAFSQYSFLDPEILGTSSYYAFKSEYAEMMDTNSGLMRGIMKKRGMRFAPQIVERGADNKPKYRNLEKLRNLISPYTFRVLKKDCLDLPEKIYKNIWFDLTPAQRKSYNLMREDSKLVLEGEESVVTKLAALGKLSQISSGYFLHPDQEEPVRIEGDNPKLNLIKERIEAIVEEDESVIIWARYHVEIDDIVKACKEIGIPAVQYHGRVKKEDRVSAIEDFESGKVKVFIGQQQAGGTGITLIKASNVIYYSNTFSLEDRLQSEDRAHRIGQTKNVVYYNFIAKDTIDVAILKALENKQDIAQIILGDKSLLL